MRLPALLLAVFALAAAAPAVAADAARGQELYESRCGGCHSLDANRVGPAHRGVCGRKAGSAPNFQLPRSRTRPWCGRRRPSMPGSPTRRP